MRACPLVRSLRGVSTPKTVAFYAVSPVTGGRPRWSGAQPWPPAQEVPYPARVRFYDKGMASRWADVVIDRASAEAEASIVLPKKEAQRRRAWAADRKKQRQRARRHLQERVERLERELAAMKAAERKDP